MPDCATASRSDVSFASRSAVVASERSSRPRATRARREARRAPARRRAAAQRPALPAASRASRSGGRRRPPRPSVRLPRLPRRPAAARAAARGGRWRRSRRTRRARRAGPGASSLPPGPTLRPIRACPGASPARLRLGRNGVDAADDGFDPTFELLAQRREIGLLHALPPGALIGALALWSRSVKSSSLARSSSTAEPALLSSSRLSAIAAPCSEVSASLPSSASARLVVHGASFRPPPPRPRRPWRRAAPPSGAARRRSSRGRRPRAVRSSALLASSSRRVRRSAISSGDAHVRSESSSTRSRSLGSFCVGERLLSSRFESSSTSSALCVSLARSLRSSSRRPSCSTCGRQAQGRRPGATRDPRCARGSGDVLRGAVDAGRQLV